MSKANSAADLALFKFHEAKTFAAFRYQVGRIFLKLLWVMPVQNSAVYVASQPGNYVRDKDRTIEVTFCRKLCCEDGHCAMMAS